MEEGWIKIYRPILGHWIWDYPKYIKWWEDLLINANWQDTKVFIKGKFTVVKRGQQIVSIRLLRERWKYKNDPRHNYDYPRNDSITDFLNMLVEDGMIELDKEIFGQAGTLITICNYDYYQSNSAPTDNGTDNPTAYGNANGNGNENVNANGNAYGNGNENNNKNNKNNKELKEIINHSDARARMREELEDRENQYVSNLLLDTKFWEDTAIYVMASTVGWSIEDLKPMSNQFLAGIRAIADFSNSEDHFRRRFQQWLKSQVDFERKGKRAVLQQPQKGPLDDYIREHIR